MARAGERVHRTVKPAEWVNPLASSSAEGGLIVALSRHQCQSTCCRDGRASAILATGAAVEDAAGDIDVVYALEAQGGVWLS